MNKKSEITKANTAFKDLRTAEELVNYLDAQSKRLENSPYLFQYTRLSSLVAMVKNKKWHLCNAEGMNDVLEYRDGDKKIWDNLFFTCFMGEDTESIGMWSMYAQPWEDGVKIGLPQNKLRVLARSIKTIYEVNPMNYELTGRSIFVDNDVAIKISSVAYSNRHSLTNNAAPVIVSWSNKKNINLTNELHSPLLTGYIKDTAWSYEKEVRLKTAFRNTLGFRRVAIDIPDEVIDSLIITASPLFKGDLQERLNQEIAKQLKTEKSLFTDKLNIKTPCEKCEIKKAK